MKYSFIRCFQSSVWYWSRLLKAAAGFPSSSSEQLPMHQVRRTLVHLFVTSFWFCWGTLATQCILLHDVISLSLSYIHTHTHHTQMYAHPHNYTHITFMHTGDMGKTSKLHPGGGRAGCWCLPPKGNSQPQLLWPHLTPLSDSSWCLRTRYKYILCDKLTNPRTHSQSFSPSLSPRPPSRIFICPGFIPWTPVLIASSNWGEWPCSFPHILASRMSSILIP